MAPVIHAELIGFARPGAPAEDGCSAALAFANKLARGGAVLSVLGAGPGGQARVSNIAMAL